MYNIPVRVHTECVHFFFASFFFLFFLLALSTHITSYVHVYGLVHVFVLLRRYYMRLRLYRTYRRWWFMSNWFSKGLTSRGRWVYRVDVVVVADGKTAVDVFIISRFDGDIWNIILCIEGTVPYDNMWIQYNYVVIYAAVERQRQLFHKVTLGTYPPFAVPTSFTMKSGAKNNLHRDSNVCTYNIYTHSQVRTQ